MVFNLVKKKKRMILMPDVFFGYYSKMYYHEITIALTNRYIKETNQKPIYFKKPTSFFSCIYMLHLFVGCIHKELLGEQDLLVETSFNFVYCIHETKLSPFISILSSNSNMLVSHSSNFVTKHRFPIIIVLLKLLYCSTFRPFFILIFDSIERLC